MVNTVLVADDDPHILEVICFALKKAGMQTHTAKDGKDVLEAVANHDIQLIILDINMPEYDGLEVCREIRKTSDIPILFLSSRDEEIDRIIGLEIGGDDYVTKPFSPRELIARVKVILKRTQAQQKQPPEKDLLSRGLLNLEPYKHVVSWNNKPLKLTATEFSILRAFLEQPERVFNRDNIIETAYAMNIHVSDRTIDSHIRHIRSKFQDIGCDTLIETIHGVGYKLGTCE